MDDNAPLIDFESLFIVWIWGLMLSLITVSLYYCTLFIQPHTTGSVINYFLRNNNLNLQILSCTLINRVGWEKVQDYPYSIHWNLMLWSHLFTVLQSTPAVLHTDSMTHCGPGTSLQQRLDGNDFTPNSIHASDKSIVFYLLDRRLKTFKRFYKIHSSITLVLHQTIP